MAIAHGGIGPFGTIDLRRAAALLAAGFSVEFDSGSLVAMSGIFSLSVEDS